jgi:hypothetical protein
LPQLFAEALHDTVARAVTDFQPFVGCQPFDEALRPGFGLILETVHSLPTAKRFLSRENDGSGEEDPLVYCADQNQETRLWRTLSQQNLQACPTRPVSPDDAQSLCFSAAL